MIRLNFNPDDKPNFKKGADPELEAITQDMTEEDRIHLPNLFDL